MNAFEKQIGGSHYKDMPIQVTEFCQRNQLNHIESSIIKYACRHRKKGKRADVEKIIHYAELLLDLEYPVEAPESEQAPGWRIVNGALWSASGTTAASKTYCWSCGKQAYGNQYCADCEAQRGA